MAIQARVEWQPNRRLAGLSGTGHHVMIDPGVGEGERLGPRPKEFVLLGLGGCSGVDVALILERMRLPFDQLRVDLETETAPEDPKVFTHIRMVYQLAGKGLAEHRHQVERAIRLSQEKYCGVAQMLNKTATIDWVYEIEGVRYKRGSAEGADRLGEA